MTSLLTYSFVTLTIDGISFKNNGRFQDVRKLILSNLVTDLWPKSKINTKYIHTLCMRASKALVRLFLFPGLSEPQLLIRDKKYVLIQFMSI